MVNCSIYFTDSLKMDIMKYCWSFIRSQGYKFLDCEITTASGVKLLTNKCFLIISNKIWKCLDHRINGQWKILMPSFNEIEIRKELGGFVVPLDQPINPIQVSCSLENQTFINSSSNRQLEGKLFSQIVKSVDDNQTVATYQEKQSYQWQCEHCGQSFQTSKQCRQHRYQVHKPANNHCCTICGAGFKTKSILSNHMRTHNSSSFSCERCSKVSSLPFITLFLTNELHLN